MDQPNEEKDLEIENDPIVKELMTEYGKQLDTVISKYVCNLQLYLIY